MKRLLATVASATVLLAGVAAVWLYTTLHSFDVERVTDDVYVIRGLGGNVGVLATGHGAVVVDTMTFLAQGRRIRERAEKLGRGPVQAILNTHYHQDHTHGNPAFPAGSQIVSTTRTRDSLLQFDADYWEGEAASALPNDTFDDVRELRVGGKTIRALHLGRGHTGGDLVVHFVEDRVVHLGDLLFQGRYPRVDLEGGGSVREWVTTLDRVLELDFDRAIPGHGPTTDRDGVLAFRRFLAELATKVGEAAAAGLSLDETLASVELTQDAGLEDFSIPFVMHIDRDTVVRWAWQEATGAVTPAGVPPPGSAVPPPSTAVPPPTR